MSDLKSELAALRIEREPDRPERGWIKWVALVVLLAGAGAGTWIWLQRPRPIEVQTAVVTERAAGSQAAAISGASGYVTARRRATVSSKITGKVIEVNVEEGMAVKEGQVLARLDDATHRASLALAQAQAESAKQAVKESEVHLVQARINLRRATELVRDRIGTQAELDSATADVDATVARIAALQEQIKVSQRQVLLQQTDLDNTVIRAPFTGIAISKDAQPGEMVSPVSAGGGFTRTGICTIVDMGSLEIEVDINESYINRVRPGQQVSAVLDAYPDWQIPAHVITVVPTADRQKATVLVRIGFEHLDPRILPDMGVKVTFFRDQEETPAAAVQAATLVPKTAIQTAGDASYVFVVTGDTVDRRAVKIGGTDGDRVEVVAGLRANDRVVVAPPSTLSSGARVVLGNGAN